MNRGRGLAGVNSYHRTLGFDPHGFLRDRLAERGRASWLDLRCGEGKALIQAAGRLAADGAAGFSIVGVDPVGRIAPVGPPYGASAAGRPLLPPGLGFLTASVASWNPPTTAYDLITCVQGLHYIGGKLNLLTRAAHRLADDGLFIADFDPASIRAEDGRASNRRVICALRQAGAEYDGRRHRVTWRGRIALEFPAARYLGADDAAGPAYTGQPAVSSHYDWSQPAA